MKNKVMLLPSPPNSGSIGSVTKMLGIAKILKRQSCEVCFVIGGNLGEFLRKEGFTVYDFPIPKTSGKDIDIDNILDFIEWTGLGDELFIKYSIKAELDAIKIFKPTVIFAETRPSAAISAKIAGIPFISIASWSCSPDNPCNRSQDGRLIHGYNHILKEYKLTTIENVAELFFMRSDVKLAPTLPELEPEMLNVKGVHYTGYILDISENHNRNMDWYKSLGKENQIFIYLSVGALNPNIYMNTIIDSFKNTPYNIICGCGFHFDIKKLPENISNIRFANYIPLQEIIQNIQLMIFHGGQDTMLTALLNGIPSITFPGHHFEREYNANKTNELGLSKKCSIYGFRPKRLNSIIKSTQDGIIKANCEEFKNKFHKYGGTKECIDIILKMSSN